MSDTDISIIIVDDMQFSRVVVKTALKKAGYNDVRMAGSAAEALTMIDQQVADVILADWMMPEMDGIELTQRVRQRDEEKGTYTAIILFTAHDGIEYLVKAFDYGVDDYLVKPPNPQELAARVNAAARIAALQNDLLETSRQLQDTINNLEEMALLDSLTGAGNQQFFIKNLSAHLQQASTRRGGVCVAQIELRELNNIIETYGQTVADEILVSHHRRLLHAIRPTDIVARLDDNIFGIIMHHTNAKDFRPSAIERILTMIDYRAYKTTAGNLPLTGCVGVHYYNGDETRISAEDALRFTKSKLDEARQNPTKSIAY